MPTKRLLINFLISFMPSYWVISIGAAAVACQPLGWVGFLFGTLTLHFPFFVGAMGPAGTRGTCCTSFCRSTWSVRLFARSRCAFYSLPSIPPPSRARARPLPTTLQMRWGVKKQFCLAGMSGGSVLAAVAGGHKPRAMMQRAAVRR